MHFENLTFLVNSCDKYSVCWSSFCHGLHKYWPYHLHRLYFTTNHLHTPCGKALKLGEDNSWVPSLLAALDHVETEFILCAQEDYWTKSPVPKEALQDYLAYLEDDLADCIWLNPAPEPDEVWERPSLSIWRKS